MNSFRIADPFRMSEASVHNRGRGSLGEIDSLDTITSVAQGRLAAMDAPAINCESLQGRITSVTPLIGDTHPDPFGLLSALPAIYCPNPEHPFPVRGIQEEIIDFIRAHDKAHLPSKPLVELAMVNTPPLIHFIWLGGVLKREDFLSNIQEWAKAYPNCEVVLWVDHTDEEFLAWCKDAKVRALNIYESIPQEAWEGTLPYFRYNGVKIEKNWGEASDILRYVLLYHFGGLYVDCDVQTRKVEDFRLLHNSAGFALRMNGETPGNNDVMFAAQHHPFIHRLMQNIEGNYKDRAVHQIFFSAEERRIEETLVRTGPRFIQDQYDKFQIELKTNPGIEVHLHQNAWSWVKCGTDNRVFSFSELERMTTEILFSLTENPHRLSLYDEDFACFGVQAEEAKQALLEFMFKNYPSHMEAISQIFVSTPESYASMERFLGRSVKSAFPCLVEAIHQKREDLVAALFQKGASHDLEESFPIKCIGSTNRSSILTFAIKEQSQGVLQWLESLPSVERNQLFARCRKGEEGSLLNRAIWATVFVDKTYSYASRLAALGDRLSEVEIERIKCSKDKGYPYDEPLDIALKKFAI